MVVNKKYIHIGKGAKIHKGAIIGYKTLRKVKSLDLKIGQNLVVMAGAVIYAGTSIRDGAVISHNSIVREENRIGDNFCLWNNSIVDYGCKIGDKVKIHCNVYVAQYTKIEDDVFIGPGTTIANDLHPKCKYSRRCMRGPHIKRGAIIGAGATINPFVLIGERAFIGAGSVVTKDIPSGKVVCGNPAKIICSIKDLKCRTGLTDFPYMSK